MKILIAAASFATSVSGLQRHAFNVAQCLLLESGISEVHIVVAPWQLGLIEQAGIPKSDRLFVQVADVGRSSLSRNAWYYRELPKIADQLEVDAVHLSYPMPINKRAFHCPTVVSLHDLYPYEIPSNFGFPKCIFNRVVLQQCLRNADSIACVSESTYLRLRNYVPARVWQKSIRIYNCVEPGFCTSAVSPIPGWSGEQFLLCIAQHRRNKNIPVLIKAFELLKHAPQMESNMKLVIIGMRGPETPAIEQLIDSAGLADSIYLLEGLREPELQWSYSNCAALVAPSIIEGFGLPVAEGLLAGSRVVCSDIPAHREIGEGLCRFVSLRANAEVALFNAISSVLMEPKPAPASFPHFSGPVLAKEYLALYRRLIARAPDHSAQTSALEPGLAEGEPVYETDQHLALEYRGK